MPGAHNAAQFVQGFYRRPSLAARVAGLVFLLVIALPMVALLLCAAILSVVVFGVLSIWSKLVGALTGSRPQGLPRTPGQDDAGRKNVRVRR
jgi:hypothetical protein